MVSIDDLRENFIKARDSRTSSSSSLISRTTIIKNSANQSFETVREFLSIGSIYKNRPAQTCYHHAREQDILSKLEDYLTKVDFHIDASKIARSANQI